MRKFQSQSCQDEQMKKIKKFKFLCFDLLQMVSKLLPQRSNYAETLLFNNYEKYFIIFNETWMKTFNEKFKVTKLVQDGITRSARNHNATKSVIRKCWQRNDLSLPHFDCSSTDSFHSDRSFLISAIGLRSKTINLDVAVSGWRGEKAARSPIHQRRTAKTRQTKGNAD